MHNSIYLMESKFFPNFIIIEVMARGNFKAASTKFHVNILITNNWNLAPNKGQNYILTNKFFVSTVFRVTATAISPNMVSGLVVATISLSCEPSTG